MDPYMDLSFYIRLLLLELFSQILGLLVRELILLSLSREPMPYDTLNQVLYIPELG